MDSRAERGAHSRSQFQKNFSQPSGCNFANLDDVGSGYEKYRGRDEIPPSVRRKRVFLSQRNDKKQPSE